MMNLSRAFDRGVLLGAGAVGNLFRKELCKDVVTVETFDIRPAEGTQAGSAISPEGNLLIALDKADIVVLALPEAAVLASLQTIAGCVRDHCLIVETSSVKTPVLDAFTSGRINREVLGVNPLFGPSLGFSGQTVASVSFGSACNSEVFHQCMARWGAQVVSVSASQHDELMSVIQAALHAALLAFGALLHEHEDHWPQLRLLATPPFRAMSLLVSRVFAQNPATYFDIQANNPFASDARNRLLEQLQRLNDITNSTQNSAEFERWFHSVARQFAPVLPQLMEQSDAVLSSVPRFRF